MDETTLRVRVLAALETLRYNDESLLELRCHERSVAGRLQIYLAGVFPAHDVDIEYNRHGVDTKKVPLGPPCRQILSKDTIVIPDLIIHKRRDNDRNLLVIEVKMDDCTADKIDCDRSKLAAIKSEFGYAHTLLLQFPSGQASHDRPIRAEWDGVGPLKPVL
jgi:hypothetical protein